MHSKVTHARFRKEFDKHIDQIVSYLRAQSEQSSADATKPSNSKAALVVGLSSGERKLLWEALENFYFEVDELETIWRRFTQGEGKPQKNGIGELYSILHGDLRALASWHNYLARTVMPRILEVIKKLGDTLPAGTEQSHQEAYSICTLSDEIMIASDCFSQNYAPHLDSQQKKMFSSLITALPIWRKSLSIVYSELSSFADCYEDDIPALEKIHSRLCAFEQAFYGIGFATNQLLDIYRQLDEEK